MTLAGLAREARILLPVKKDEKQQREERENTVNRNRMIAAARNGDEEAMENLTMEDIDTYSMTVSYTHLRAHETDSYLVCRLLLEKKKKNKLKDG